jgi:putative ABC transport system permease protein
MTLKRLRLRNLLYHWRGNFAVFLGVVVGTTVLTGSLLVGDSLRGSLRDLTLKRLGWVDDALIATRFFRAELADELTSSGTAERICPVILLQATVVKRPGDAQVRGVTVIGVDERFWSPQPAPTFAPGAGGDANLWVNSTLADALHLAVNDRVSLRVQKPSAVPRETLLGRRDESAVVEEWPLTVGKVLTPEDPGDHFSLRPELEAPRTAFVPLSQLQEKLGLGKRCNALLAGGPHPGLSAQLRSHLRLADWGLVLQTPQGRADTLFRKLDRNHDDILQPREWRDRLAVALVQAIHPGDSPALTRAEVETFYRRHRNYLSLESTQLLLEPFLAEAALAAAKRAQLRDAPTLVYLANTIAAGGAEVPYSVVAALDPALSPPLGPFLPDGIKSLANDEIVLADWKDSPLPRKTGEKVTLSYFPPTHQGELREEKESFRLAGFVPLEGVTGDPDLTPEFPGITDKLRIDEWDPPFPYDNKRIKKEDEQYWKEYRTTPKAYVNPSVGQRLWGSRFGRLTSIRLAAANGEDPATRATVFERTLLQHLDPAQGGLVFNPVKELGLEASTGGTDFAQLLLGFSFFLIVAALLLVGLLFRLNLDRRAAEIGTLLAVGYRLSAVRRLLLGEGCVLAAAGAVIGSCAAMLYTRWLLQLLAALWPGQVLTSFLRPHFTPLSLVAGAGGSLVVSVLTILWAIFSMGRVAPNTLLAGQVPGEGEQLGRKRPRWSWWIAGASLVGGVVLLATAGRVQDHEMRAMSFFGSGSLLLTACLATLSGWMRSARQTTVEGAGAWGIAQLGIRNAARHPGRSMLTAGLLASAAFLIVAVEAFRRHVDAHEAVNLTNGGFNLVAESDLPLFHDLNTETGRRQVTEALLPAYRDQLHGDNATAERRAKEAGRLLEQVQVVAFRVHAGDDASCLNLYQPLRPRLLGVPTSFLRGHHDGFQFAGGKGDASGNPWGLLESDAPVVPAFGEKNTVEWILKSELGGVITLPPDHRLRIAGLLQDSVFQSSLLISEPNFLRMYPDHEGYNYFLIRTPAGREDEVKHILETAFAGRGLLVTPTVQRLASYLAVENTYLSTFQALGGLGLVLGSLGLAIVLLRGVWERRGELALLRSLGFRRLTLGWLVLTENAFLLLVGLLAGTVSALIAVAPHLWTASGAIPWLHLLAMLAGVLVVGLTAGALATASTLRAPLILALRRE